MTTTNGISVLRRSLSVIGKLLAGTRKGPSGGRVRELKKLQRRIGVRFTDVSLLEQALTHRSYSHVTSQTRNASNERMEFLGDSVLGLAVSQFLYLEFPDRSEGALSKMKSLLVSRKVLSSVSREIGLGEFLLLSGEESDMGGRDRTSILADSFEGVIGAIYLDQGYRAASRFIRRFLLANMREILLDEEHTNYKSLLQEYVQAKRLSHPTYRVRKEEGPEHEKEFAVEVVVRGEVWGSGRGKSKKEAEQNAARSALEGRQGREASAAGTRARSGRARRGAEVRTPAAEGGARKAREPQRSSASAGRSGGRARTGRPPARHSEPAEPAAPSRSGHGVAASREKLRIQRQAEAERQERLRRERERRQAERRKRAERERKRSAAPAQRRRRGRSIAPAQAPAEPASSARAERKSPRAGSKTASRPGASPGEGKEPRASTPAAGSEKTPVSPRAPEVPEAPRREKENGGSPRLGGSEGPSAGAAEEKVPEASSESFARRRRRVIRGFRRR